MKKKLWISLSGIIAILFVGLIIAGNYFYNEGIKRGTDVELHRGSGGSEPADATVNGDSETMVDEAEDWYNNQKKETLSLESYDDLTLSAQYINNDADENKTVILAHGFRNTGDDMGKYARSYYDKGFNILLPDARGHGDSEGDYIGYGWHDRLDYLDWIDVMINNYSAENIILHGESMGASTVLMSSGEDLPEQVDGIIADSGYSTVKQELAHQLKNIYNLPAFPLLDVTSVITQVRAGYMFGEASAVDQVEKNTRPLLIIHGKNDDLVPTDMANDIYEAAGGDKERWLVPDTGHTEAFDNETKAYQNHIEQFLDRALDE